LAGLGVVRARTVAADMIFGKSQYLVEAIFKLDF
jgi:hypothetical protein